MIFKLLKWHFYIEKRLIELILKIEININIPGAYSSSLEKHSINSEEKSDESY